MGIPLQWALCALLILMGSAAEAVTYSVHINNTWSEQTHPGLVPEDAHFSWFAGATHTDQVSFWEVDQPATPGIKDMAETGGTSPGLRSEVLAAVTAGTADQFLEYRHWFCPPETNHSNCGPDTVEIETDSAYPLFTFVSMLGPSPDWFVGVSGLPLMENGSWRSQITVDLTPFDAGTRSDNRFALFGSLTTPPAPISVITHDSGQIITPQSLGTMTLTLVPEPSMLALSLGGCLVMMARRRNTQ